MSKETMPFLYKTYFLRIQLIIIKIIIEKVRTYINHFIRLL